MKHHYFDIVLLPHLGRALSVFSTAEYSLYERSMVNVNDNKIAMDSYCRVVLFPIS